MSSTPRKIHCRASQEVPRGLISLIRVNIPVGQLPVSLPEGVRSVSFVLLGRLRKRWQGVDWRRRQCTTLSEDGVALPVHALEPDGFVVGKKGDDVLRVKFADIACRQHGNGLLGEAFTGCLPVPKCLGVGISGAVAQRLRNIFGGLEIGLAVEKFRVHIVSDGFGLLQVLAFKLRVILIGSPDGDPP
jgi:hypothetical protein